MTTSRLEKSERKQTQENTGVGRQQMDPLMDPGWNSNRADVTCSTAFSLTQSCDATHNANVQSFIVLMHKVCSRPHGSVVLKQKPLCQSEWKRKQAFGERRLQTGYKPPTLKGYVWYKLSHPQFSFFSVRNENKKKSVGLFQFPFVLAFNCHTVDMHQYLLKCYTQCSVHMHL